MQPLGLLLLPTYVSREINWGGRQSASLFPPPSPGPSFPLGREVDPPLKICLLSAWFPLQSLPSSNGASLCVLYFLFPQKR